MEAGKSTALCNCETLSIAVSRASTCDANSCLPRLGEKKLRRFQRSELVPARHPAVVPGMRNGCNVNGNMYPAHTRLGQTYLSYHTITTNGALFYHSRKCHVSRVLRAGKAESPPPTARLQQGLLECPCQVSMTSTAAYNRTHIPKLHQGYRSPVLQSG